MFRKTSAYSFDNLPGYFEVPFTFTPNELNEYVKANIDQCRMIASNFVKG